MCKKCAILDDILRMEQGLDMILDEEGHNLSVGQKHRIGLARVMLKSDLVVIIITHSSDFIINGASV